MAARAPSQTGKSYSRARAQPGSEEFRAVATSASRGLVAGSSTPSRFPPPAGASSNQSPTPTFSKTSSRREFLLRDIYGAGHEVPVEAPLTLSPEMLENREKRRITVNSISPFAHSKGSPGTKSAPSLLKGKSPPNGPAFQKQLADLLSTIDFDSLDANKDGLLEKNELRQYLLHRASSSGIRLTEHLLEEAWNKMDANHSGMVNRDEYKEYQAYRTPPLEATPWSPVAPYRRTDPKAEAAKLKQQQLLKQQRRLPLSQTKGILQHALRSLDLKRCGTADSKQMQAELSQLAAVKVTDARASELIKKCKVKVHYGRTAHEDNDLVDYGLIVDQLQEKELALVSSPDAKRSVRRRFKMVEDAFTKYDRGRDGTITASETRHVLNTCGQLGRALNHPKDLSWDLTPKKPMPSGSSVPIESYVERICRQMDD